MFYLEGSGAENQDRAREWLDEAVEIDPTEVAAMHECLQCLTVVHLQIVRMLYFTPRQSERQIAEIMGWSVETVRRINGEAREQLRSCLIRKGIE